MYDPIWFQNNTVHHYCGYVCLLSIKRKTKLGSRCKFILEYVLTLYFRTQFLGDLRTWPWYFRCRLKFYRCLGKLLFGHFMLGSTVRFSRRFVTKIHNLVDFYPQSRKSAELFLQSSEMGLPSPLAASEFAPPTFGPGGRAHSLAGEGLGESPFRRGDIHCVRTNIF